MSDESAQCVEQAAEQASAEAGSQVAARQDAQTNATEAALPIERAEHPGGEGFFSGEAGNLSDAEAEDLARQQLLRSGLLRGQRVRVAD